MAFIELLIAIEVTKASSWRPSGVKRDCTGSPMRASGDREIVLVAVTNDGDAVRGDQHEKNALYIIDPALQRDP